MDTRARKSRLTEMWANTFDVRSAKIEYSRILKSGPTLQLVLLSVANFTIVYGICINCILICVSNVEIYLISLHFYLIAYAYIGRDQCEIHYTSLTVTGIVVECIYMQTIDIHKYYKNMLFKLVHKGLILLRS